MLSLRARYFFELVHNSSNMYVQIFQHTPEQFIVDHVQKNDAWWYQNRRHRHHRLTKFRDRLKLSFAKCRHFKNKHWLETLISKKQALHWLSGQRAMAMAPSKWFQICFEIWEDLRLTFGYDDYKIITTGTGSSKNVTICFSKNQK